MIICEFKGVGFGYPGQALILKEINFKIHRGESCLILGPNGSGKSTFALLTGKILAPTTGVIDFPSPVTGANPQVGLVFQRSNAQVVGNTVEEDLAFGLTVRNLPAAEVLDRVANYLELFGLTSKRHFNVTELSGGELRRLALAAVLITQPDLLILDEPLAMLDNCDQAFFLRCLRELVPPQTAVIWIDQDLKSIRYTDTWYLIDQGRIQSLGLAELNNRDFLKEHKLAPTPLQFLEWQFSERVSGTIWGPESVGFHDSKR